jgi:tripartite-type tricarboxylate transporter receptor subunit TctC
MLNRRQVLKVAVVAAAIVPGKGWAQDWPATPIRTIVPFPPGGATDIIARIVFNQLANQLGQSFVIENRSGAGGTIGAAIVAKSNPDGYTIMVNSISYTIAAVTYSHLPYNSLKAFSAVISLGAMPNLLMVSPVKGYKSLHDLVEEARKNPGGISYGSAGVGSISHLSGERLKLAGHFQAVHVPYPGAPQALLDLMAGRIDFFFSPYLPAKPFIDNKTLVALAIASEHRSAILPDVPTTAEAGYPNTEYPYWNAIFVPARTPRSIVNKLHDETVKAMEAVKDKLAATGTEPMITSPEEFDAIVRKQIAINADLVKIAGIQVN